MKTCKECRYYMPNEDESASILPNVVKGWGECHMEPPQVVSTLSGTSWRCPPLCSSTVACRQFEEKAKEPA